MPTTAKNQGEGDRKADRRYRTAATEHASSGRQKVAAKKAKQSVQKKSSEER